MSETSPQPKITLDDLKAFMPKLVLTSDKQHRLWVIVRETAENDVEICAQSHDPQELHGFRHDLANTLQKQGMLAQFFYAWRKGQKDELISFLKSVQTSHHDLMKLETLLNRQSVP